MAAADQLRVQRGEISGANVALRSVIVLAVPGTADNAEPGSVAIAVHGDTEIRNANGLDAGKFFDLADDAAFKRDGGFGLAIDGVGPVNFQRGEMIGLEAEVYVEQTVQTFSE